MNAIVIHQESNTVLVENDFEIAKEAALVSSALIGRVSNREENESAIGSMQSLREVQDLLTESKESVRKPLADIVKAIDVLAAEKSTELREEFDRLSTLVTDYQILQDARIRAEENSQKAFLLSIEREREERLTAAKTTEEYDQIRDEYSTRIMEMFSKPPSTKDKAKGQRVGNSWEFEVTDSWALARARMDLVDIRPRRSEIKAALNIGDTLPGVKSWKKTKVSVGRVKR